MTSPQNKNKHSSPDKIWRLQETRFKNFFPKTNDSHETSSTCAYCHRLSHSKQFCPLKVITFRGKLVKSVWIPKRISISLNEDAKKKWIPKGTKIVSTNTQRPKKFGYPKQKLDCVFVGR